jgi:hypothetical protein
MSNNFKRFELLANIYSQRWKANCNLANVFLRKSLSNKVERKQKISQQRMDNYLSNLTKKFCPALQYYLN